jgi:hypothetical protein
MARGGYGRCFCVIYNTAGQLFDCEAQPSVMPAHFVRPQPAGQVAPHHCTLLLDVVTTAEHSIQPCDRVTQYNRVT